MIQLFFIDNSSAHMKYKQQCQSENYSITLTRPVDSATTEIEIYKAESNYPITSNNPIIFPPIRTHNNFTLTRLTITRSHIYLTTLITQLTTITTAKIGW